MERKKFYKGHYKRLKKNLKEGTQDKSALVKELQIKVKEME